jgi:hypothetical protein
MAKAQPNHQPAGPPLTQYGRIRRQRVMNELRHGRPLAAEDMPVAAALLARQRSQRRWLIPLWVLVSVSWLCSGIIDHGFLRYGFFGALVCGVFGILLQLREQRQLIRNYQRQNAPNVDEHRDDVTP